ncbi:hypothetical protein BaRGS_00021621 [Batillaria attramentaria]|uniref:Secreted protein n=1 Tax=Batillaria attramentaria TaxID=370345 RepID=A0ABD0KJ59_9CAEN
MLDCTVFCSVQHEPTTGVVTLACGVFVSVATTCVVVHRPLENGRPPVATSQHHNTETRQHSPLAPGFTTLQGVGPMALRHSKVLVRKKNDSVD